MTSLKWSFATACACIALAMPAWAEGDPAAGARIARESCAICHNVERGGPFKLNPPSFAAIAVYRSDNQIRNRILYPDVHSPMRRAIGFVFSIENVEDLVAYIRSLEVAPNPDCATK